MMIKKILAGLVVLMLIGCGTESDRDRGLTEVVEFDNKFFLAEFNQVKECTGIEAEQPNIVVVEEGYFPYEGYEGFYDGYSQIIFLLAHKESLIKHEMVHYLLHKKGDLDANHKSPLFVECGSYLMPL